MQNDIEVVAGSFHGLDGILRNDTAIVFNINIQVRALEHACSELEDFGETIGAQPMMEIAADVSLQYDFFFCSHHPAAIDEVSNYLPDFGDMSMGRDVTAIG